MNERVAAIIYDFDGVIADSEMLANSVLAEMVSALGCPTSPEEAVRRYSGKRLAEAVSLIEADTGRTVPHDFGARLAAATLDAFRKHLRAVPGARGFITRFDHLPRCIASSSSPERLRVSLELLDLDGLFAGRVFSAEMVERGKPHPDLFLLAAQRLGCAPSSCLVIEDSASGIAAARAAGMRSIGLCAASHIAPGHAGHLQRAGATCVASSWAQAQEIAMKLLEGSR